MNKFTTFFMVLLFAFALIISSCSNKNTSPGVPNTGTNSGGGGSTGTTLASRTGDYTNDKITMNLTASGSGSDLKVTRNNDLGNLANLPVNSTYHLSDDTNSANTSFTNSSIPILGSTVFTFDDTLSPTSLTVRSSSVLGLAGSSITLHKK